MLFYRMNQPQPLSISVDFQGYLVCQIPADALEVELNIKNKWGKFTLHTRPIYWNGEVQSMEKGKQMQNTLQKEKAPEQLPSENLIRF